VPELLIELFSEEIPARMQARAAEDLRRLVTDKLKAAGLAFTDARAFVTPRRLALVVDGVPAAQQDVREEKKGPRVGSPDKAIEGFLKGAGLASLDACEKRDTGKGEFWFAVVEKKGSATRDVLPQIVADSIMQLSWPKSMHWGTTSFLWVRPLHHVVALFEGEHLRGGLALGPYPRSAGYQHHDAEVREGDEVKKFQSFTEGHRFMGSGRFAVKDFADYRAKLLDAKVMIDAAERAATIKAGVAALAANEGLVPVVDEGLLAEVAGLVEWPVPLMGRIDESFMDVPREVLTTSMRVNQKYFTFNRPDGSMAPRFGVIANMVTEDGGKTIIAGNEKVLSARLSDARFFWDQDRKVRLDSRVDALKGIVFHAQLGTVFEKMQRVRKLAAEIAPLVGADPKLAERAATLAKADLTTGMVGEFPELQGVMGRYYANNDGEDAAVVAAIAEHYSPLGPGNKVPTAPVSIAVALADKLDTLTGFFAIDEKPTGSKDPFALRRAALGVIRIVLENSIAISLNDALELAVKPFSLHKAESVPTATLDIPFPLDVFVFLKDRLRVYLRDKGVQHDFLAAALSHIEGDFVRVTRRLQALQTALSTEHGASLVSANRRASNILKAEEKRDGYDYSGVVDPKRLIEPAEKALFKHLRHVKKHTDDALKRSDFDFVYELLGQLREPIDAFFDKVTVNVKDQALRENRLRLLMLAQAELNKIADLSQIEG